MALPFFNWSRTAASNATADSTVNWAEGMAPSAVNDSARAMMASLAGYRDDISGAITTGGTSSAYTLTSYQVFDTLAHMDGKMIAFTPHATNVATTTLSVDGLSARGICSAPGVLVPDGALILGTPYVVLYNNANSEFYLHGFYGNPYNVPLGSGLPFFASTAPNSSFVFPFGQAISRTTYSALFAIFSTQYGPGNGSTTFNVPDLRGRLTACIDNMGGSTAGRITNSGSGIVGTTLGAAGGGETQTLTTAQLPVITPVGSFSGSLANGNVSLPLQGDISSHTGGSPTASVAQGNNQTGGTTLNIAVTGTVSGSLSMNSFGSGTAHPIVQPTFMCNFILRII